MCSKARQSSGPIKKLRQNVGWSQEFGGSSVMCRCWDLFLLQLCQLGSLAQQPLGRVFAAPQSPISKLKTARGKEVL